VSAAPFTLWLTGRPGAGKTTLGRELAQALMALGRPVRHLDGHDLRAALWPQAGFTRQDRALVNLGAAWLAATLNQHGVTCVVGTIAPYAELRAEVATRVGRGYLEVFLDCPLEQALNRDAQGLYARALSGELPLFTGLDDPYEDPAAPFLRLPTSRQTPGESLAQTLTALEQAGHLPLGSAAMLAPAGEGEGSDEQREIEARLRDLGYVD
jgi:adenylylsulfate kinase-like enzyme